MPQDSQHPLYTKRLPQWRRCRDAVEGTDAIKAANELYLPRPSGMTDTEYRAYKTRATWFGASRRTLDGLQGMVFRKNPVAMVPERLRPQLDNITGTLVDLNTFAVWVFAERLRTGHVGICLDLPDAAMAVDQSQPHWTLYQAEQIINWSTMRQHDGTLAFTQIIVEESVDALMAHDHYEHETQTQWREFVIRDGQYVVRVWQRTLGGPWRLLSEKMPTRFEEPLAFIPFHMDLMSVMAPPPILDIVDVNLSHYRTSADYEHDLHMTCMKTPYVIAQHTFTEPLRLGGLEAWHIPVPRGQAEVGLLEPNGASLQAKLDKMNAAEQQMAVLGARLLEPQKRAAEAAETLSLRQSGEQSVVQTAALDVSRRLSALLRWHAWWTGVSDDPQDPGISVQLNTDVLPHNLTPQELDGLVAAWQGRALTQEALHYNLLQGEMLPPDEKDFALYVARLETQNLLGLGEPLGQEDR